MNICSYLYVRVVFTSGAPLAGTSFLLAMFIKLRVPKNGYTAASIDQCKGSAAIQTLFVCGGHG